MIKNLNWWVQSVLPLVYDDSLSFYELVNKVVEKLNEVINSQNNIINEWEDFQNKFDENLMKTVEDLLNKWKDDGTLEDIINRSLFNGKEPRHSISIKEYGAIGDGITDDAPAIRTALSKLGENDILYFPKGEYLIESFSGTIFRNMDFAFILQSSVTIIGDGAESVIKFCDNAYTKTTAASGAALFLGNLVNDVTISNININMNGYNNLKPVDYQFIIGYPICFWNSSNIKIDNVNIYDIFGRNAIVLNGDVDRQNELMNNAFVHNCTINTGGTSIPLNTTQNDYSAIYVSMKNVVISNTVITNKILPLRNSGGIEVHNSNFIITNCTIENSHPAIYVANSLESGTVLKNVNIENNFIRNCSRAIYFLTTNGDIENVQINNNNINTQANTNITNLSHSLLFLQNEANDVDTININNNIFSYTATCLPECQLDKNNGTGLYFTKGKNVNISNNIFKGFNNVSIVLSNNTVNNPDCFKINNNMFYNTSISEISGSNSIISITQTGSVQYNTIKINDNVFYRNMGSTNYGVALTYADSSLVHIYTSDNIFTGVQPVRFDPDKILYMSPFQGSFSNNNRTFYIDQNGIYHIFVTQYLTAAMDIIFTTPIPNQVLGYNVQPVALAKVLSVNAPTLNNIHVELEAYPGTVNLTVIGR